MSFKKHHFSWKCSKFYLNIYPITFASFSVAGKHDVSSYV